MQRILDLLIIGFAQRRLARVVQHLIEFLQVDIDVRPSAFHVTDSATRESAVSTAVRATSLPVASPSSCAHYARDPSYGPTQSSSPRDSTYLGSEPDPRTSPANK